MLGNILRQPIGERTVASLGMPDAFLHRVADRIIRKSYVERYRIVVADSALDPAAHSSDAGTSASATDGFASPGAQSTTWIAWTAGVLLCVVVVWMLSRRRASAR